MINRTLMAAFAAIFLSFSALANDLTREVDGLDAAVEQRNDEFQVRVGPDGDFPNSVRRFQEHGDMPDPDTRERLRDTLERYADTNARYSDFRKRHGIKDEGGGQEDEGQEDSAGQGQDSAALTRDCKTDIKSLRKFAKATKADGQDLRGTGLDGWENDTTVGVLPTGGCANSAAGEDAGEMQQVSVGAEKASETASSSDTVWADEFNGDWRSNWSSKEKFHGDAKGGRDGYGASAWNLNDPGDLATVENGELVLRSKHGCQDGKMCTAELISDKSFTHGKVEVRAKFSKSADAFMAIWSTGKQDGDGKVWPAIGEIDWAELAQNGNGDSGKPHFTVHTAGGGQWNHASVTKGNAKSVDDGKYHTFAIERTPERITQIVDGEKTGEITRKQVIDAGGDAYAVFDRPHIIRLNTGADNKKGWADNQSKSPEEAELRVDYVRVMK